MVLCMNINWYITNNKEYFNNDENFAKKATEYIKTNLEKYAKNKYKDIAVIVQIENKPGKEILKKNEDVIKNNKIVDDLYNMEAEFFVEYENKYVLNKR